MTTAEVRVLEARMDMLDAVLRDLVARVRRMQSSDRAECRRRAPSGTSGGPVVQRCLQVVADGFEDRAAHEFVGLREADPAHFG
jgi:hypothetical protein